MQLFEKLLIVFAAIYAVRMGGFDQFPSGVAVPFRERRRVPTHMGENGVFLFGKDVKRRTSKLAFLPIKLPVVPILARQIAECFDFLAELIGAGLFALGLGWAFAHINASEMLFRLNQNNPVDTCGE